MTPFTFNSCILSHARHSLNLLRQFYPKTPSTTPFASASFQNNISSPCFHCIQRQQYSSDSSNGTSNSNADTNNNNNKNSNTSPQQEKRRHFPGILARRKKAASESTPNEVSSSAPSSLSSEERQQHLENKKIASQAAVPNKRSPLNTAGQNQAISDLKKSQSSFGHAKKTFKVEDEENQRKGPPPITTKLKEVFLEDPSQRNWFIVRTLIAVIACIFIYDRSMKEQNMQLWQQQRSIEIFSIFQDSLPFERFLLMGEAPHELRLQEDEFPDDEEEQNLDIYSISTSEYLEDVAVEREHLREQRLKEGNMNLEIAESENAM